MNPELENSIAQKFVNRFFEDTKDDLKLHSAMTPELEVILARARDKIVNDLIMNGEAEPVGENLKACAFRFDYSIGSVSIEMNPVWISLANPTLV